MKTPPSVDPTSSQPSSESSPSTKGIRLTGGLSRRHVLIGLAAVMAEAGFWSNPLFSNAQTPPANSTAPAPTPEAAAFFKFSTHLTGHADLNQETAARIASAMHSNYPDFATQFPKLTALMQERQSPKELLAAASDAGLRDLALAIVAAWYTGTVGHGKSAVVVAYAEALMYRPVADAQTVPTYCNYGPLWWTKAPPAVRVAPPSATLAPAPRPATTGTPEPTSHSL